MKNGSLSALAAALPAALVALALTLAAGVPRLVSIGAGDLLWELLFWGLCGALAATHRPLGGGSLGLGTLVLPTVVAGFGAVPAALLAGAALIAAEALRGAAERRATAHGGPRWGCVLGALPPVVGAALAAGAAAAFDAGGATLGGRLFAGAAAYVATFVLLAAGGRWLERLAAARTAAREQTAAAPPRAERLLPLVLDAGGWALGALLAAAALTPLARGLILLAFALLAAEAARNAVLHGASDHRVGSLERVQQAHVRILGEISGMGGIARQILIECRNVVPVQWFQLELIAAEAGEGVAQEGDVGGVRSWSSGPDAVLRPGLPRPPARPQMLPGVHRRAAWRLIEHALRAEGEVLAVVRLWCDPRQVKPGEESLLASLVPQMASSVHRALLDREAKLDPLTGVPVRRLLESRMQKAYRQCCTEGQSMAVIMCDIDFFKRVNDSYGHAAGDQALILVARTLESQRRQGDLCCRYGGEEFTLLLEETGGEAALQLAERLRSAVEALAFVFEDRTIPLTLSAGVAAFPELHIKTASELLLLADEALYEAKSQGRNRCLLNLGQGSFRTASGEVRCSAAAAVEKPAPPRIFG